MRQTITSRKNGLRGASTMIECHNLLIHTSGTRMHPAVACLRCHLAYRRPVSTSRVTIVATATQRSRECTQPQGTPPNPAPSELHAPWERYSGRASENGLSRHSCCGRSNQRLVDDTELPKLACEAISHGACSHAFFLFTFCDFALISPFRSSGFPQRQLRG